MIATILCAVALLATDLQTQLAGLDAPKWRDREAATMAIARDWQGLPIASIETLLRERTLSPEQRARLVIAIERRVFLLPRAAMGVRLESQGAARIPGSPEGGVMVTALTPGLPAEHVLKPGDIITQLDDTPVHSSRDLVMFVQSHWPGTSIRVHAMRRSGDDKWNPVVATLTLGSVDAFPEAERPRLTAVTDEQRRTVERIRRLYAPRGRQVKAPQIAGRGSAAWMTQTVLAQRLELEEAPLDQREQLTAVATARWRTWLKAVDMRLGDRFLDPVRREELEAARTALLDALASLER